MIFIFYDVFKDPDLHIVSTALYRLYVQVVHRSVHKFEHRLHSQALADIGDQDIEIVAQDPGFRKQ